MKATLMQSWLSLAAKFDVLNKRERLMVLCASVVVAYAVINTLLLSPLATRQKSLTAELTADQAQISALQQQLSLYRSQSVVDPDAQNKQRILELQSRLQGLEARLNQLQTTLISPEKMPELLRSLLKRDGKLKLVELKTLPLQNLLETNAEIDSNTAASTPNTSQKNAKQSNHENYPVFKHGVEITVEGQYLDLLGYVSALEKMPWHVLWSKAELTTKPYPISQLKLTVYTLSLDQTWLSI